MLACVIPFLLTGCDQPENARAVNKKNDAGVTESYSLPDGKVISHYYEGNKLKEIYVVNAFQHKEGYSFLYNENGTLLKLSRWENGVKEGRELIFSPSGHLQAKNFYQNGQLDGDVLLFENSPSKENNGGLSSHQLFRDGVKIYEGFYQGDIKEHNKLYPYFLEEFFFEDKYYAKVRFLLNYPGQVEVQVKGQGHPVIEYLGDNTFQLVINDALDLNKYKLELSYQQAVRDTLIAFSYVYPHIIYMTE